MLKFNVANLASTFVLLAATTVTAAPDSNASSPPKGQTEATAAAPAETSDSQTPASKPAPAKVAKQRLPSDIICKPDTGTGSRVGGMKICLTREQWRERED